MAVDVLAIVATWAGLVTGRRVLRSSAPPSRDAGGPVWRRPWVWFAVTVAALYVNQVLCTIYILRVHGGDPSFIADHLPAGWFDLVDDNRVVRAVAEVWPLPEALEVTVLRVPALLELPFAVLAYLTVIWWVDRALYLSTATSPLVWAACLTYSTVFCLVELALPNPYTAGDVVLRVVSAVVTPPAVRALARGAGIHGPAPPIGARPVTPGHVAAVAVGLVAFGVLVLMVYDTALLYNLAHLPSWRFSGAAALAALVAAWRVTAGREPSPGTAVGARPAGPATTCLFTAARWFLVLCFVPALPIRYTLGFGSALVGLMAALALCAVALGAALRATAGSWDLTPAALTVRVSACVVAGALAGAAGWRWQARYPELTLLVAVTAAAVGVLSVAAWIDRVVPVRAVAGAPTVRDTGGRDR